MSSETPRKRRGRGGWWFLLLMVAVYVVGWWLDPAFFAAGFGHFLDLLGSVLPILLVVMLLIGLMSLTPAMEQRLQALSGDESGLKGWLLAIVGGVLSHGPVYPWYPLLQQLQAKGARPALLAAFLYARSVKLPFLPLMAHYFGLGYTVIVTLLMILFSIVNGRLVEALVKRD